MTETETDWQTLTMVGVFVGVIAQRHTYGPVVFVSLWHALNHLNSVWLVRSLKLFQTSPHPNGERSMISEPGVRSLATHSPLCDSEHELLIGGMP